MSPDGPPRLAVGADVLGPEEVGHELVGRRRGAPRSRAGARRGSRLAGLSGPFRTISRGSWPAMREAEAVPHHAEVVVDLGLELELLDRRDPDVAGRLGHRDHRRAVPGDVDHDLGRSACSRRPSRSTSWTLIALRVGQREGRAVDVAAVAGGRERRGLRPSRRPAGPSATSLLRRQSRVSSVPSTAVTWRMSSTVFGSSAVYGGKTSCGVGPLELGVLEHLDAIGLGAPAVELDAVGEVGVDRLDAAGERRIFQAAGHRPRGWSLPTSPRRRGSPRPARRP